jgi:hypothetical protein
MKSRIPLFIVLVLALWFAAWGGTVFFFDDWEKRGQFGDLFGSVNALFSGLAFAGVIYAIFLQRQELALQREELKLQREEMVASREEFAAQAEAQRALVKATIAQIKVAAQQARISGIQMEASRDIPYATNIHQVAERIQGIADGLEKDQST